MGVIRSRYRSPCILSPEDNCNQLNPAQRNSYRVHVVSSIMIQQSQLAVGQKVGSVGLRTQAARYVSAETTGYSASYAACREWTCCPVDRNRRAVHTLQRHRASVSVAFSMYSTMNSPCTYVAQDSFSMRSPWSVGRSVARYSHCQIAVPLTLLALPLLPRDAMLARLYGSVSVWLSICRSTSQDSFKTAEQIELAFDTSFLRLSSWYLKTSKVRVFSPNSGFTRVNFATVCKRCQLSSIDDRRQFIALSVHPHKRRQSR